jgi:ribosomal protein S18 acetylase RimI-like enzyme
MKIIEYEEKYLEDVKDLLVELEEYILTIDEDELDQLHPEYREKMTLLDLQEVNEKNGKCYLAIEDDKAIGLIMGTIIEFDEYDYLDYKCPKEGEITELIVTSEARKSGVGQMLINKMEEYFKSMGCEYILVDVFAYNKNGIKFYDKQGYHPRMHTGIKKIK